ncbi:MAG TPA: DUF47 family protein [Candidatus Thermoplasmatota archaeon]|nr:DUF47 family protein [Candidatus Thermoplasmatota archaeon]
MKLKDWLVPREEKFFDLLREQSIIVREGADALVRMLTDYTDVPQHKKRIKEIEHKGDLKTHDLYQALNATFITPLDREDIARMASALDDILDYTFDTAKHLYLYEVKQPPKELREMAEALAEQTRHLSEGIAMLEDSGRRDDLRLKLIEIHRLENHADELADRAKAEMFRNDDVKTILKMKDIFEYLETATDKCEDAADVIRDILVKHQ